MVAEGEGEEWGALCDLEVDDVGWIEPVQKAGDLVPGDVRR